MCENKGKSLTEIRAHSCIQDRVAEIEQRGMHDLKDFSNTLHMLLPTLFTALIHKYSASKNIQLGFMKFGSRSSPPIDSDKFTCPIRVLNTRDRVEHQWISRIKDGQSPEGHIQLESVNEILSFFKIAIDSTFILLAIRREMPPSASDLIYDLYAVWLELSGFSFERVKPFILKLKN